MQRQRGLVLPNAALFTNSEVSGALGPRLLAARDLSTRSERGPSRRRRQAKAATKLRVRRIVKPIKDRTKVLAMKR